MFVDEVPGSRGRQLSAMFERAGALLTPKLGAPGLAALVIRGSIAGYEAMVMGGLADVEMFGECCP